MSFVPFGMNLQLQSGVPLQKVASVFLERLTATKRLDGGGGGGMAGLMQSVTQFGNLSGVMSNPMAAITGAVQGQLPGLVTQLQGMVGGGPTALINALTGGSGSLNTAMQAFQAAGDNLAGLTNGAQGFFAMMGHATTADIAGSALPAAAAMDVVTAPLASFGFLSQIATQLPGVVANVVSGAMTPDAALTWVQAQIAQAGSIIAGSAAALAWGESMHPLLATASSVAGALAIPRHLSEAPFQRLLGTLVQPAARDAMDAAMAEQMQNLPALATPEERAAVVSALRDLIDRITSLED